MLTRSKKVRGVISSGDEIVPADNAGSAEVEAVAREWPVEVKRPIQQMKQMMK